MSPLLKKNKGNLTDKQLLRNYCFYSAAVSCGIMLIVFLVNKVIPFYSDTNTVLRMDLYHQYGPLYSELYDRIVNGGSLIYSWRSGLGGGFLGNFFNYCCSPFAVVMLIFGHKNMPEAIAAMFLLKAMLASATFTYYLNKTNHSLNRLSVVFGPMYAFCSYFVAYSWNIMWIDAMAVFPLVILGVEKIIQTKKPWLFIFAMTYTMITNYYMAYMVCILCVLYFLYYYFSRYDFLAKINLPSAVKATPADEKADSAVTDNATDNPDGEVMFSKKAEDTSDFVFFDSSEDAASETESIEFDDATEENGDESFVFEDASAESDVPLFAPSEDIPAADAASSAAAAQAKKERKYRFRDKRFFATGFTFAFSAILCFFLAAFALLPVYYCLQTSSATSAAMPEKIKQYFNIFDFLANHLPATVTTIRSSGTDVIPNVYCGLVTVMMIPLYFFSDKVPGRKKITAAVLLSAFYFGFSINFFNFIWHGFHFPNDLPYRFSFAYSFVLLILAYKVMTELDEFSKKTFTGIGMSLILFVALITKLKTPNNNELSVWLTVLFTVLYTIVFGLYYSPRYSRKNIQSLLMFTIVLELIFSDANYFVMSQQKKNYVSDYTPYREIVETVEKDDNTPFYRTELTKLRARMDPCWYGYNGVSTFSSMAYEHTSGFMKKLGFFGNKINSYTYYPQTPIVNSMLGLKYIYDNNKTLSSGDYYTKKGENDKFTAYEYKYYLPIAYSVNNDITKWDSSSSNPFELQNSLMESMTGVNDILQPVKVTDVYSSGVDNVELSSVNASNSFTAKKASKDNTGTVKLTIKAETAGYYYTYAGSTKIDSIKISADNGYLFEYTTSGVQPFILDIGHVGEGDEIEVTYTVTKDCTSANISFCAARLDREAFEKAYNTLKSQSISINEFNETNFNGTIKTTADSSVIFTSIPYDQSWVVKVDGKVLQYVVEPHKNSTKSDSSSEDKEIDTEGKVFKACGSFIGVDVGEGEHTISFEYVPNGLSKGIKLTVIGIGILGILIVYELVISKKLKEKNKRTSIFFTPEDYID